MITEQEVTAIEPTGDKPDSWLRLKVKDKEGKTRDKYLKTAELKALVKNPGVYAFEMLKEGQYWEVKGVKFVRPLGQASTSTNGGGQQAETRRSPAVVDVNVVIQNKAITAQVAIKAAAEVVRGGFEAGAFKSKDGVVDFGAAADATDTLAGTLMETAGKFVRGKSEEPKKDGTYTDNEGRTHEPVPEGA